MRYGWSLNEEDWDKLTACASGLKWARCFLESDYANDVPLRSGVYLICADFTYCQIDGSIMKHLSNTIYVGQATVLRTRFNQHVRGYRLIPKARHIFRRLNFWYSELERERLNDVEQAFIDAFGPTANEKNVKAVIGAPIPAGRIEGV